MSKQSRFKSSIYAADLTEIGAVRNRAADRIDDAVSNDQIEVDSIRTKGIIARRSNLRTSLPPAVLATDHIGLQRIVQTGACPDAAFRCFNFHPIARMDAALGGGRWMQLNFRIQRLPAQAGQLEIARVLADEEGLQLRRRLQRRGVPGQPAAVEESEEPPEVVVDRGGSPVRQGNRGPAASKHYHGTGQEIGVGCSRVNRRLDMLRIWGDNIIKE